MEKSSSAPSPVKFEVLSLISLLISLFNEVISFLVDLILRFSFNFQSCLSIHRFIRLFARILSVFVLSSIIINPFRNDFWFVLILYFLSLLRISHLYDLSKSTAHSDCHLWLIKLSRRRSNFTIIESKMPFVSARSEFHEKSWSLICSKCM